MNIEKILKTVKLTKHASVGDAGWFSNIHVKISSPDEITAPNMARVILKEIKRPIKKIANAQVKEFTIRFQLLVQDALSKEWIWMECPLTYQLSWDATRKASKESEYGAEKLLSAVTKKLKTFEGKTIYENKSYFDSVKDGWINVRGTTRQGYEVRAIYNGKSGRLYAVIYRPGTKDFLVAVGYNQQRGDWDQGYYDYKSEEEARKFAEKHAKQMYDSMKDAPTNKYRVGQRVLYKGKNTEITKIEYDPKYGYDLLIVNPFYDGRKGYDHIWVGEDVKVLDSVKDSDKLKQMAYKFAQMGNYFDRANSARSRNILAKEDDQKYAEFYNYGLQVLAQLKQEVEGIKKNATPANYSRSFDNDTLNLLNDGANRLYWIASDRRDKKGDILSKKILELAKEYRRNAYDSVKDGRMSDLDALLDDITLENSSGKEKIGNVLVQWSTNQNKRTLTLSIEGNKKVFDLRDDRLNEHVKDFCSKILKG